MDLFFFCWKESIYTAQPFHISSKSALIIWQKWQSLDLAPATTPLVWYSTQFYNNQIWIALMKITDASMTTILLSLTVQLLALQELHRFPRGSWWQPGPKHNGKTKQRSKPLADWQCIHDLFLKLAFRGLTLMTNFVPCSQYLETFRFYYYKRLFFSDFQQINKGLCYFLLENNERREGTVQFLEVSL